jgi:hypothetical protein
MYFECTGDQSLTYLSHSDCAASDSNTGRANYTFALPFGLKTGFTL